jgi:hypothetical protein
MPDDEWPMTKECRMTNVELAKPEIGVGGFSSLGIRHSFVIRH